MRGVFGNLETLTRLAEIVDVSLGYPRTVVTVGVGAESSSVTLLHHADPLPVVEDAGVFFFELDDLSEQVFAAIQDEGIRALAVVVLP